jgi:DNA-binding transcriptional LysR family regulator
MAGMTLDQLRILIAIAKHRHVAHAAEALYLTQSSVNTAIQSLEDHYGIKLLHRNGRRVEMTEAGKMLHNEAQKILNQVTVAEQGLQEFKGLQRGQLTLGASFTVGNYWLPDKISQFKQEHPGIQIHCTLGNTEDISLATATGSFDLSFVEGEINPAVSASLEQTAVGSDRVLIVVGQSHPWFTKSDILVSDLLETDWILQEPASQLRMIFEQALQLWGIGIHALNVVLEMSSSEMVKAVVESGAGATAISELTVQKELQLGSLRAVQITGLPKQRMAHITRFFLQIKCRQRFQTRLAQAFEQMLLQ